MIKRFTETKDREMRGQGDETMEGGSNARRFCKSVRPGESGARRLQPSYLVQEDDSRGGSYQGLGTMKWGRYGRSRAKGITAVEPAFYGCYSIVWGCTPKVHESNIPHPKCVNPCRQRGLRDTGRTVGEKQRKLRVSGMNSMNSGCGADERETQALV